MEFIFLGTSAGCPTKHRNMTALALKQDQGSSWYLIDAGEGTQQQVLKTSLSLYKLKHIFITHMHGDHIFGLPGLLCSRNMSGCLDPIHIYGPQGIKGFILSALGPSQCHPEYDIIFHEITKDRESFEVDDFKIKVIQLSHNITSYAYSFQEAEHIGKLDTAKAQAFGIPAGPLYGDLKNGKSITLENGNTITPSQVIGPNIKGRRFIIGGDNDSPGLLVPELKNCDLLIHESTYTDKVFQKIDIDLRHSTAKVVASTAESNQVKNLILTHFSVRYQDSDSGKYHISEIEDEAKKYFKKNLYLANDLDVFTLKLNGQLSLN